MLKQLLALIFPTPVQAQVGQGVGLPSGCTPSADGLNLGDCVQLSSGQTVASVYNQPADLVNLIAQNIFIVGGLIIFFMILYSGFLFIQNGTKGKDEAKSVMTNAAIGGVVLFSAYWIVQIVVFVLGFGNISPI